MLSQDDARRSNVIVSPTGIIHVLGYTPTEGERGVPITVRIHFHPELADAMYVRLVVGHKAVVTKVRELPGTTYGRWQLDAAAPPFDAENASSSKVHIAVQALNDENAILDSVTFGEFSYWTPAVTAPTSPSLRRRPSINIPPSSPTLLDRTSSLSRRTRLHRRPKSQTLMRTRQAPSTDGTDDLLAQTPILDVVTPLSTICLDWDSAELNAGRRLVRFSKIQDGRRLIVSCETISQEDFNEADSVISCIYREEVDTCYVTSVDVIYLLERLTNSEFPVEEKNRIRRNLEGLRPTTVSKHKPGFGDFFQRIMEFPDPKPRNIEKDLKVFEWNLLGQALEKILSKYSIYSETPLDTPGSTPPTSFPESPKLYALQLAYPQDSSSSYLEPTSSETKCEPLPDDFPFISKGPGSDTFASGESSVTGSSPSSAYPIYTPKLPAEIHPLEVATHASWTSDYKGFEDLNTLTATSYEATGSVPVFQQEDTANHFHMGIYEGLSLQNISDDALASLTDRYL